MSAVTGDDDPRSLVVWESAPKGMIVPISPAVAGLFQFATVDPKVGGRNRLQPVYYVSSHDATSLRFKLYASTAFSSSSSLTQEL